MIAEPGWSTKKPGDTVVSGLWVLFLETVVSQARDFNSGIGLPCSTMNTGRPP